MSNFPKKKFLATSKATNKQNTFIKPTPEGSPVLTLGIYYKGQGRTRHGMAWHGMVYFCLVWFVWVGLV